MIDPAKALPLWRLEGATVRLAAARENAVYKVDHASGRFAMRFHRKGYRTDLELKAELNWMAWLDQTGLSVPAPVASRSGTFLEHVEDVQVDVLTWLDGSTLDGMLHDLPVPEQRRIFHLLGQEIARLHAASDAWPAARTCDRPAWDIAGLLGRKPLWDRFWENPCLTHTQKALFKGFRKRAISDLNQWALEADYGLIHADLVPANVMWNGTNLHLIDFDDGGFGFRLFEIATALLKHRSNQSYGALETALIDGYQSKRMLDTTALPLFMALRAATYVGWNITRMAEDETSARNARFIAQAEDLVIAYMDR